MLVAQHPADRRLLFFGGGVVFASAVIAGTARVFGPDPYITAIGLLVMAAFTLALMSSTSAPTVQPGVSRALRLFVAVSAVPTYGTAIYFAFVSPTTDANAAAGIAVVLHILVTGTTAIAFDVLGETEQESAS